MVSGRLTTDDLFDLYNLWSLSTNGYWSDDDEEWPCSSKLKYWVNFTSYDSQDGLACVASHSDAMFIAKAHEAIPQLVSEVLDLRNELHRYKCAHETLQRLVAHIDQEALDQAIEACNRGLGDRR